MSRQEDFIQAGIDYRMKNGKPMCIAGGNLADVERDLNRVFPFEAGAEYGYTYAVDKMAEYLLSTLEHDLGYFATGDFVKGVMKFMEGL